MSGWLDAYAKRAARTSAPVQRSVSRRRVLAGGSVVATAWAAPMLTSSPAYAYGVSACARRPDLRAARPRLQFCCAGHDRHRRRQYTCARTPPAPGRLRAERHPRRHLHQRGSGHRRLRLRSRPEHLLQRQRGSVHLLSSSPNVPYTDHICGGYGVAVRGQRPVRPRLHLRQRALLRSDLQRERPVWRQPHLRERRLPSDLPGPERLHLARAVDAAPAASARGTAPERHVSPTWRPGGPSTWRA